jgi:hypothetical protein
LDRIFLYQAELPIAVAFRNGDDFQLFVFLAVTGTRNRFFYKTGKTIRTFPVANVYDRLDLIRVIVCPKRSKLHIFI